jgi:hypothetical protein
MIRVSISRRRCDSCGRKLLKSVDSETGKVDVICPECTIWETVPGMAPEAEQAGPAEQERQRQQ